VLTLSQPDFLGGPLLGEIALANFFVPLAVLFGLSLLSVINRDQIDAYRRLVTIPASLGIAVIGTWWFIERVFL
jgi:hypothetical protein